MMTRSQTIAAAATNAATNAATATSNNISSADDTTKVVYPSMFSRWAEPL
jgi:hypothetical protein